MSVEPAASIGRSGIDEDTSERLCVDAKRGGQRTVRTQVEVTADCFDRACRAQLVGGTLKAVGEALAEVFESVLVAGADAVAGDCGGGDHVVGVAAVGECPHPWPMPGSASYSQQMTTCGPVDPQ